MHCKRQAYGRIACAAAALLFAVGCQLAEKPFPMERGDFVPVRGDARYGAFSTREWLSSAHRQLEALLPKFRASALLTDDMRNADGSAVDVWAHFDRDPDGLRKITGNLTGLIHTVQGCGGRDGIDNPPPMWPGFRAVEVLVDDDVALRGRLGMAVRDGEVIDSDCVVILGGFFGDNSIWRLRDLGAALRDSGLHVLAIEMRGHGQTEAEQPHAYYTFGVQESVDLLLVSEWAARQPHVRETGLVGYCWGGNIALLSAFYDRRPAQHEGISKELEKRMRPVAPRRHFTRGVLAFSPVLGFEDLIEEMGTPRGYLADPVIHAVQQTVRGRMERKDHPNAGGNLRHLIDCEFASSRLNYEGSVEDAYRYLRILPRQGRPGGEKLEYAQVPVAIVHGANDVLNPAQLVADLIAQTDNDNVAAVILPGGGHVGFAPYARAYYYSLVLNFFDPERGAAANGAIFAERFTGEIEPMRRIVDEASRSAMTTRTGALSR